MGPPFSGQALGLLKKAVLPTSKGNALKAVFLFMANPGAQAEAIERAPQGAQAVAPTADPQVDLSAVKRILQRRRQMFRQCYESALKTNKRLNGRVVLEATMDRNGEVRYANVIENELGDKVGACSVAAIKRIRFPQPGKDTVTFQHTLVFKPAGEQAETP